MVSMDRNCNGMLLACIDTRNFLHLKKNGIGMFIEVRVLQRKNLPELSPQSFIPIKQQNISSEKQETKETLLTVANVGNRRAVRVSTLKLGDTTMTLWTCTWLV